VYTEEYVRVQERYDVLRSNTYKEVKAYILIEEKQMGIAMSAAKQRYMVDIVEEFPNELQKPMLRLVDAVMERAREEFAVRREDLEKLWSVIAELAEAQKRTEERVSSVERALEDLAQAQKRTEERMEELAQAQKRTEERVSGVERALEELAQAQKRTEERMEELAQVQKRFEKHFDVQIGALGSRWGIKTEESFRAAAEGILSEDFGLHVERYEVYDELGEAFGRPEPIEIDLLIRDGKTTAIEIKSSMSKYDVHAFDKKVAFYEKRHQVKVDRKLIITPMLDPRARELVRTLRMNVYTSSYEWGDEEIR
jgi:hypothetical protein